MRKRSIFFILVLFVAVIVNAQTPAFRNKDQAIDVRVNDLLQRLTPEEKAGMLGYESKPVDRLNIPSYNWWNEGLHGVARAGNATIFPQAIAMAASFDPELMQEVGDAVSTEARAKYNMAAAQGRRLQYMGLTFWSPNINIFRDPRWGRGQETYGEDPFLTGTMGVAYIKGLQGNDAHYLKVSACAKHFAAHSGPEATRHSFNAIVDEKELRETYLYAFHKLVDAGVQSVMCGYNRLNGEPCCTGQTLLKDILRNEWQFKGQVVTDCGALDDIFLRHKVLPDAVTVAAEAVKAGVNMDCSNILQDDILKARDKGLLKDADIDAALAPSIATQMKLGLYDAGGATPYDAYNADSVHNAYHIQLAKTMALRSIVLLKNNKRVLPLSLKQYSSFMVVGPNAASIDALLGNYHGVSPNMVNFVEGITGAVGAGARVEYDLGCNDVDTVHFGGTWAASNADVTIAVIGLSPVNEGEEGDAFLAPNGGDRLSLELPASHIAYIKALRKAIGQKPLIVVVTAGSAINIEAIEPYADAVILAWYPGEQGGAALADILVGNVAPSGHLPITFYQSLSDLPDYSNYHTAGRTYRYFKGAVQYPFGYGLSYTHFIYTQNMHSMVVPQVHKNGFLETAMKVTNDGMMDGETVVQCYVQYPNLPGMPVKELKAFQRVKVSKGSTTEINIKIPANELQKWDDATHQWKLYPGNYTLIIGEHAQDEAIRVPFIVE